MKTVKLTFLFCLMAISLFAQKAQPANDILADAFAKAAQENKKVFLKFSASWCGWCKKMDAAIKDSACRQFFDDNFVIVQLVVDETEENKQLENPGADEIRIKYNGSQNGGLPYWVVLDSDGQLLADSYIHQQEADGTEKKNLIGCPASEEEVTAFIAILKKTTTLSSEQLAIIHKRFRENERKRS